MEMLIIFFVLSLIAYSSTCTYYNSTYRAKRRILNMNNNLCGTWGQTNAIYKKRVKEMIDSIYLFNTIKICI